MKKKLVLALAIQMSLVTIGTTVYAKENIGKEINAKHITTHQTGYANPDGGVAEIVKFNSDNNKIYLVNGAEKKIDIIKLNEDGSTSFERRIDVSQMIPGFKFGDLTSIDVSTQHKTIAIAVQHEDYKANGAILLLDYEGNYIKHIEAGVQPDMVTLTPDGKYVLTADEGEPRVGYGAGVIDPKGTVTIVDISKGASNAKLVKKAGFESFDSKREELVQRENPVLLKKGAKPSEDLEPEYIAVSEDSKKAYISLQEANAIATLDLEKGEIIAIDGLGFKDHSQSRNALDMIKDGKIVIKAHDNVYGTYMPDGIATYEVDGKTYLVTANEGDGREYIQEDFELIKSLQNEYKNITKLKVGEDEKGKDITVEILDTKQVDGLDEKKNYLFGGRSFSIWDTTDMSLVYDSGSDFEMITSLRYPEVFNTSNKNTKIEDRSGKKGVEAEDVKVGKIGDEIYAFVGLERIGGIMIYNITNPKSTYFVEYVNDRDLNQSFEEEDIEALKGNLVSPEGLCFIEVKDSPTGKDMLLVAHEVSGTVGVYEIEVK